MGQFQNAPGPSNEEFNNVVDQIVKNTISVTSETGIAIENKNSVAFESNGIVYINIAFATVNSSKSSNTWINILTMPSGKTPSKDRGTSAIVVDTNGDVIGVSRVALGTDGILKAKTNIALSAYYGFAGINIAYKL